MSRSIGSATGRLLAVFERVTLARFPQLVGYPVMGGSVGIVRGVLLMLTEPVGPDAFEVR